MRDYTRWECPTPGTTGVSRPCRPTSTYDSAIGWRVQLWDKDASPEYDDYIGTWNTVYVGWNCATFEWENAAYSQGEANPDVYLRITNEATKTSIPGTVTVDVQNSSGVEYSDGWTRNGPPGDPDLQVAVDCQYGSYCYIYPEGEVVLNGDNASDFGQAVLAVDSAQRFLQIYAGLMDPGKVWIRFPEDTNCPVGAAWSRTLLCLPGNDGADTSGATNGRLVTHELGHVLQMQLFEQDSLVADYSLGGDGWGADTEEYESAATVEGWAVYTSAVSWYNPQNASVAPFAFGYYLETAQPIRATCSENGSYAVQVARGFWDLDDINNEAAVAPATAADTTSYTTTSIAAVWDDFDDGTDNHEDRESNTNPDRDAVNMRDYAYWSVVGDSAILNHNCLQYQDSN